MGIPTLKNVYKYILMGYHEKILNASGYSYQGTDVHDVIHRHSVFALAINNNF